MANTKVQLQAERWVVRELERMFGVGFAKSKVSLTWGGAFEFDAVSIDGSVVACVSTSKRRTARGRPAIGKLHKIRSDVLFLLNARGATQRVLVFTDAGMVAHFEAERARGRFPPLDQVELRFVRLPDELTAALTAAQRDAAVEVSPQST